MITSGQNTPVEKLVVEKVDLERNNYSSTRPSRAPTLAPSTIPYHVFSPRVKIALVAVVSIAATLSGLSSNIFFPAIQNIAKDFSTEPQIINLSITTYLIAQGIAPSFWSPLADHFGRRTVLILTLTLYFATNIVLALAPDVGVLTAFRALQAAGSSSTISLGQGVITDLVDSAFRGSYTGYFSGVRQSSIALGPVLGGVLTQYLGWRSIFWTLVIMSGLSLSLIILCLPETLRRIAGNGSTLSPKLKHRPLLYRFLPYTDPEYTARNFPEHSADIIDESHTEQHDTKPFRIALFFEPFWMLIEKDVACALFFGSFTYTAWSMVTAVTTVLLSEAYKFDTLQIGLCYLANGLGCVAGSLLSGRALNETFRREQQTWNYVNGKQPSTPLPRPLPQTFPIERARLVDAPLHSIVMIIGFLIFGWSLTPPSLNVDSSVTPTAGHWITPLLALFMIGYSNTAVLNSNSTLIVDLFPGKSASASAVVNLSRNVTAAIGVAVVDYILEGTGPGWLGVLLAGLVVVGIIPLTIHGYHGMRWRGVREKKRSEQKSRI